MVLLIDFSEVCLDDGLEGLDEGVFTVDLLQTVVVVGLDTALFGASVFCLLNQLVIATIVVFLDGSPNKKHANNYVLLVN